MAGSFDRTISVLQQSLEAASLRQQVLANNIANINTPGFKRSHVDFEQQLAEALRSGLDPSKVKPAVVQETGTSLRPDGNNVDIEVETTEMAQNEIQYMSLAQQLSDQLNRMRMVIRGGV